MNKSVKAMLALAGMALLGPGIFIILIQLGIVTASVLLAFAQPVLLVALLICSLLLVACVGRLAFPQTTGNLRIIVTVLLALVALVLIVGMILFYPVLLTLLAAFSAMTIFALGSVCCLFGVVTLVTAALSLGIKRMIENRILSNLSNYADLRKWIKVANHGKELNSVFSYTAINKQPLYKKIIDESIKAEKLYQSVKEALVRSLKATETEMETQRVLLVEWWENSSEGNIAAITECKAKLNALQQKYSRDIAKLKRHHLLKSQDYMAGLMNAIRNEVSGNDQANDLTVGQKFSLFALKFLGEHFDIAADRGMPQKEDLFQEVCKTYNIDLKGKSLEEWEKTLNSDKYTRLKKAEANQLTDKEDSSTATAPLSMLDTIINVLDEAYEVEIEDEKCDEKQEQEKEDRELPEKIKQWYGKKGEEFSAALEVKMDVQQVQEQQNQQNVQLNLVNDAMIEVKLDSLVEEQVDYVLSSVEDVSRELSHEEFGQHGYALTRIWLEKLERYFLDEGYKAVKVTAEARKAMEIAGGRIRMEENGEFNPEIHRPLGFEFKSLSDSEGKGGTLIVHFDKELRLTEKQAALEDSSNVRIDPLLFSEKKYIDINEVIPVSSDKKIQLFMLESFFGEDALKQLLPNIYKPVKRELFSSSALQFLVRVCSASFSTLETKEKWIEILVQAKKTRAGPGTLFAILSWMRVHIEFTDKTKAYIERLLKCTADELSLLYQLASGDMCVFDEIVPVFFALLDQLNERGLSLPSKIYALSDYDHHRANSNLSQLPGIIALIDLLEGKPIYLEHLPPDVGLCIKLVKSGYSAVHKAMFLHPSYLFGRSRFTRKFKSSFKDLLWIKPNELKKLKVEFSGLIKEKDDMNDYNWLLRDTDSLLYIGVLLRYVAANCSANSFAAMLKEIETTLGFSVHSMPVDTTLTDAKDEEWRHEAYEKISENWERLKKTALNYPRQLNEQLDAIKINADTKKQERPAYEEPHLNNLLACLGLDNATDNFMRDMFKQVNTQQSLIEKGFYAKVNSEESKEELSPQAYFQVSFKSIKTALQAQLQKSAGDRDTDVIKASIAKAVNLLRLAHYGITKSKSKTRGDKPPKGEWLRLEQLLFILLILQGVVKGDHSGDDQKKRLVEELIEAYTDEGKTLSANMSAILLSLCGLKVDLLTHTKAEAKNTFNDLRDLATLAGLTVAEASDKQDGQQSVGEIERIIEADIYCSAVSEKVNGTMLASVLHAFVDPNVKLAGDRKADVAIVDEGDNVAAEIQTYTSMKISEASAEHDKELDCFLRGFMDVFDKEDWSFLKGDESDEKPLPEKKQAFRQTFREKMPSVFTNEEIQQNQYYKEFMTSSDKFDFWLAAAVESTRYKEWRDYVIRGEGKDRCIQIYLDTTGRIAEKNVKHTKGLSQVLVARKKNENPHKNGEMKMPGLSSTLAQGDISNLLKDYKAGVALVTGMVGDEEMQAAIKTISGIDSSSKTKKLSRAKRPAPKEANWPQTLSLLKEQQEEAKVDSEDEKNEHAAYHYKPTTKYKRTFAFPPQLFESEKKRNKQLIKYLKNIKRQGKSAVIFLDNPKECNALDKILSKESTGLDPDLIQIFTDNPDVENNLKMPEESYAIKHAGDPGMITITTVDRATDFKNVYCGIALKPNVKRKISQEMGRPGRGGILAFFFELYCYSDVQLDVGNIDTKTKAILKFEHEGKKVAVNTTYYAMSIDTIPGTLGEGLPEQFRKKDGFLDKSKLPAILKYTNKDSNEPPKYFAAATTMAGEIYVRELDITKLEKSEFESTVYGARSLYKALYEKLQAIDFSDELAKQPEDEEMFTFLSCPDYRNFNFLVETYQKTKEDTLIKRLRDQQPLKDFKIGLEKIFFTFFKKKVNKKEFKDKWKKFFTSVDSLCEKSDHLLEDSKEIEKEFDFCFGTLPENEKAELLGSITKLQRKYKPPGSSN